MQFQIEGAAWLAARQRALLADDMGLGKTGQAVIASDTIGANDILVLAPSAVTVGWIRAFSSWSVTRRNALVVAGPADTEGPGVRVVSYNRAIMPPVLNALRSRRWDLLICDEADMLKSDEAARTHAVLGPLLTEEAGLLSCADRAWGLTGTPMPNRADDLWTLLRCFAPDALKSAGTIMSRTSFVRTYCVTKPVRYARGARMTEKVVGLRPDCIPDLRERVKNNILRRKFDDVMGDVPPMTEQAWRVQPGAHLAELMAGMAADEELAALVPRMAGADLMFDESGLADYVGQMLQTISEDSLSRLRRLTGTVKARVLAGLLAQEMAETEGEKIVVMAWHSDVLDTLHDALAPFGAVRLDGSVSGSVRKDGSNDRQDAIDAFQTDPGTRVFLGQIVAAGAGITLTASAEIVFAEMSWSPRDNAQAVKRIRRIGQRRPTCARYAALAGTIDEAVTRVLRRKSADIAAIID
jgi:SWI/SNF-related matrix-associated actin-dependent regulator 1 of chromatin subfamily A